MKFAIILLSLVTTCISLAAERAVIQQMKGRRAIVQFEKDIPFSVGQKIYLNSDDGTEYGVRRENRNFLERKNLISIAAGFSSAELDQGTTKTSATFYNINVRYGWNQEQYEFGPFTNMTFAKYKNSSEISSYQFGGFFDYNFIPNKPGEDIIYGAYGEGSFGNNKNAGVSNTSLIIAGGGFVKWFIFSPALAVRANLSYSMETQDRSNGYSDITINSFGGNLGLSHYF